MNAVAESTARILAGCARELLCLTDADRTVLGAVGPWAEATGAGAEALTGTRLEDVARPSDRAALREYHQAVAAGRDHPAVDVRVTSGPRTRIFDVVLRRVDDVVVASFRDVTRQRDAEALLGALNEQLQRANAELQRSNDELQHFAYVASHDLSEPLRMVTSYCGLLVADYGDALDETAREYLGFAADGAKRMRALIDDLLAYSRVSWVAEDATRVELDDVLADALRDLGRVVADSGARVEAHPLPAVLGNRPQLGQLVTNLVGNAVKFRSPDRPPRVVVSATVTGPHVRLSVADNGIGIDEKHRERIFVMFKRLHGRGHYDGNGIGLALCKRIAELHGGTVWVEAGPDGGSVFHATLLAADAPAAPVEVPR